MRKKKTDLNTYEDMVNISNKENEILESYNEDFIEYNEKVNYDDEEFDYKEEINEEQIKEVKTKPKKETEQVIIIEDEEELSTIEEEISTSDETKEIEENNEIEDEEEIVLEEQVKDTSNKNSKYKKIINICFTIIIAILIMISIDIISVGRYNKGPYFAIPVSTYYDGGTKVYLGLGYKVIDYNVLNGRQDKQIGSWGLKYSTEPYEVKDLDLAIEFTASEEEAYKKYYKQFLKVESKLESMDLEKNSINFGYIDEGGKYTLKVTCNMASVKEELVNIDVNEEVYVIGTVTGYEFKTDKTPAKLILSDCFASK